MLCEMSLTNKGNNTGLGKGPWGTPRCNTSSVDSLEIPSHQYIGLLVIYSISMKIYNRVHCP